MEDRGDYLREASLGELRSGALHSEIFTQIYSANAVIIDNLLGMARCEHGALVDNVRAIADTERLAHVMVCYEHADAALLEEPNDALDVEHRDRVDAGEGLVEQDERGPGAERAGDLEPPPLAARERDRRVLAQMRDVQILQELGEARLDLVGGEPLQLEDRLHVLLDREAPEH